MILDIATPRWSIPLLEPTRYKGIYGGRASGKSHFFAELLVERIVIDPNLNAVCIREIQKSLKYSAKKLIEDKIQALGIGHLFDIRLTEIKPRNGAGIIIFQGMQDHTADSIKSLEGFDVAWVEEAQSLSARSLELLRPTMRKEGSEIWFSWNPENETDAVDVFMRTESAAGEATLIKVNSDDNPFLPDVAKNERERDRLRNPDSFDHVWLGAYNLKSESQIFRDKWEIIDFTADDSFGNPYYGMDFGFSSDPTAAVRCWVHNSCLWIDYEAGGIAIENNHIVSRVSSIPEIAKYVMRADSARPETISYLKNHGLPRLEGVKKWAGSVEDGIEHIKSYDRIFIHTRCVEMAAEARNYSYKIDKGSGDILPKVEDKNNHYWDAVRYALAPLISNKQKTKQVVWAL